MSDMLEAQAHSGRDERIAQLTAQKTQLEEDLRATETAFSDLHKKYEKTKEIIGAPGGSGLGA